MKEQKLEYPRKWRYTIIGADESALREAAAESLKGKDYTISFSKKSKAGKYVSLTAETTVNSESKRNELFSRLSKHPAVSTVL